jgi:hypothetical protein
MHDLYRALLQVVEIVSSGGTITGSVTFAGAGGKLSVAASTAALTFSGFKAGDKLDLARFKFTAAEKLSFVENKSKTKGTLTITSGKLTATVTLFGQYVAGGFYLASDGATGTTVTYSSAGATANPDLAIAHK